MNTGKTDGEAGVKSNKTITRAATGMKEGRKKANIHMKNEPFK